MAKQRICFSIAGEFGAELSFEVGTEVPYDEIAKAINKQGVAKILMLEEIGYTADDVEVITPEQYDAEFGDD